MAEAQRLYAEGVANGSTRPEFRPTHDIANVKTYNTALLEDNGVANLLDLSKTNFH